MTLPSAVTPEGWRIGAGFAEFLHGVGHGDLDSEETPFGLCECESNPCRCGEYERDQAAYDDAEEMKRQLREEREWDR